MAIVTAMAAIAWKEGRLNIVCSEKSQSAAINTS